MTRVKYNIIDASGILPFKDASVIREGQDGIEVTQIQGGKLGAEKFLVTFGQFAAKIAGNLISNLGSGVELLAVSGNTYGIKSLIAGSNVTITSTADTVTINSVPDGVVTSASYNAATQLLTLTRSNSLPDLTVTIGGGDAVIDGASIVGTTLVFTRTEGLANVTVDLGPLFSSYVPNTRTITGTGGLTGGGDLSVNRSISIAAGGVTNDKLALTGLDISKFTVGTIAEARLPHPYVRKDADSIINQGVTLTMGSGTHAVAITNFSTSTRFLSTGTMNFFAGATGTLSLVVDQAVELRYQGNAKLQTTNAGVTVTGPVTANQATLPTHLVRKDQVNTVVGGITLETVVVEIGTWDMDAADYKEVAHGLAAHTNIRSIDVMVVGDSGGIYKLDGVNDVGGSSSTVTGGVALRNSIGGTVGITSTIITLTRTNGSYFDGLEFNSTGINRGWITITYVA